VKLGNIFFSRQRVVEKRLVEYLDHWWECIECFQKGMGAYLADGLGEELDFYYSRIDKEESKGDELRRRIEVELFAQALLPESRGDILRVLEALDLVINRAESTIRQLVIERLQVETWMNPGLSCLTKVTVKTCKTLHVMASHLMRGEDDPVGELVHKVQEAESRCDHVEQDLLGKVFASNLDLARKLQLKDFVRRMGTISDFAESAGDRIHIVSVKRRV
jgi:predicted phosphate transport protein (TIGR00153 family)